MADRKLPHDHGEGAETTGIQEQLNRVDYFQITADVFRQLGDPTRVRIFWLLCHCEECVANISAMLEMSSPAVSHHLRPLKNSGLIVSKRDGKEVYYKAADTAESRLLHQMIEQVMQITCFRTLSEQEQSPSEYPSEQTELIREIHEYLIKHMDKRITIEELSRQYLINPTTLKSTFKAVYGASLAAHIKSHRMEQAANLLRESTLSIAEVAQAVGYDSQSKFSAAFKSSYHMPPKNYRNTHKKGAD